MDAKEENLTQIKTVISYLGVEKVIDMFSYSQARSNALEILIGLAENEAVHDILLKLDLCKILLALLDKFPEERELIIQNLVNLSGYLVFQNNLIENNAIFRISYLLFEIVNKQIADKKKETEEFDISTLDISLLTSKQQTSSKMEIKSSKL